MNLWTLFIQKILNATKVCLTSHGLVFIEISATMTYIAKTEKFLQTSKIPTVYTIRMISGMRCTIIILEKRLKMIFMLERLAQ